MDMVQHFCNNDDYANDLLMTPEGQKIASSLSVFTNHMCNNSVSKHEDTLTSNIFSLISCSFLVLRDHSISENSWQNSDNFAGTEYHLKYSNCYPCLPVRYCKWSAILKVMAG